MNCYPLKNVKSSSTLKRSTHTFNTEEFIRRYNDLYITDELIYNNEGKLIRRYRLHAVKPHSMEDYLAYDIMCPKCSQLLKVVGRPIDYNDLGLYRCPVCDKK